MSGTVYVVQEVPGRNLSAARQYGELKLLLPRQQILLDPGAAVTLLHERLKTFDSATDWLLLIGDPVAIALTAALVADRTDGALPMLKWDRETYSYLTVRAELWS